MDNNMLHVVLFDVAFLLFIFFIASLLIKNVFINTFVIFLNVIYTSYLIINFGQIYPFVVVSYNILFMKFSCVLTFNKPVNKN